MLCLCHNKPVSPRLTFIPHTHHVTDICHNSIDKIILTILARLSMSSLLESSFKVHLALYTLYRVWIWSGYCIATLPTTMSHVPGLQVLRKKCIVLAASPQQPGHGLARPEILGSWPHDLTWDPVHGEHAEMGRH